MKAALLVLALAFPGSAVADEADYDPRLLTACLANTEGTAERTTCIGIGAEGCLASERTDSPARVAGCYAAETADWMARRATYLEALRSLRQDQTVLTDALTAQASWAEGFCGVFAEEVAAGGESQPAAQQDCLLHQAAQATLAVEPLAASEGTQ